MKNLILTLLLTIITVSVAFAQNARLQVIHNSPTPNVDVYVNGNLFLEKFVYRTATPFVDVPANVELVIGIAPARSESADDVIANFPVTLEEDKTYIVIANGIVGGDPGFNLEVFDMGAETAPGEDNVGLLFFHGSPDAPEVDITSGGGVLFDDVEYGEFSGYLNVPAAEYTVEVTPANDNDVIVAAYKKDFSFWKNRTAVIFASGFLGGDNPTFEPWVALSTGGTFALDALETAPPANSAKLQVIHNSPTPNVDIYVNGGLFLEKFVYRNATPFVNVPAGVDLEIGVAAAGSESADDALANFTVNLEEGKSYIVIANGIVGGDPGFNLEVFDMGSETAPGEDNVGLLFFHGSPDAPEVDITSGGSVLFDDVEYGEFSGYLNVPAAEYTVEVTPSNNNDVVVAAYKKDFSFWKNRTAVIFASGFLGGDDPSFEPWVALSTGGTFPLDAVSSETIGMAASFNPSLNYDDIKTETLAIFPNPTTGNINLNVSLENDSEAQVLIVNKLGQTVYNNNQVQLVEGDNQFNLNLSSLSNGSYYLKLETKNKVISKPFVILK